MDDLGQDLEKKKEPEKKVSKPKKKSSPKPKRDTAGITVERGIPMPIRALKYPFATMKVGESFAIDRSREKNLRAAAYMYGRKNDEKFSIQRIDDGKEIRCWRVK